MENAAGGAGRKSGYTLRSSRDRNAEDKHCFLYNCKQHCKQHISGSDTWYADTRVPRNILNMFIRTLLDTNPKIKYLDVKKIHMVGCTATDLSAIMQARQA